MAGTVEELNSLAGFAAAGAGCPTATLGNGQNTLYQNPLVSQSLFSQLSSKLIALLFSHRRCVEQGERRATSLPLVGCLSTDKTMKF